MANSLSVNRLHYSDHGRVHALITCVNALTIYKLLLAAGVKPNFAKEGHGSEEDAATVIALAGLLHDIGNSVHRQNHEVFSVTLAEPILRKLGVNSYARAAVLECIYSHEDAPATSLEAGVVKIADGMDCEGGRARIPYQLFGKNDIHAVSALAIEEVRIEKGREKPVKIIVRMTNPAGVFQVDEVLMKKLEKSSLEDYVEITSEGL